MCFRRKKVDGYFEIDRKLIMELSAMIGALLELDKINFNEKFKNELIEIRNQVTYLSPRDNSAVVLIDNKLKDKLYDLKILLYKKDEIRDSEIVSIILDIKVLIKDRAVKEI